MKLTPRPRNWKVTFYKHDGTVQSTIVTCLKRFAKWEANVELGYPAFFSKKITVGLVK
jgi:hypothetical protein